MEHNKSTALRSLFENDEGFSNYEMNELIEIGNFLGSNNQLFREIYLAYRSMESQFETKPKIGAKITIVFFWEEKMVSIERLSVKLKFEQNTFLKFLGFIDSIYAEILPLGTVVELDTSMMSQEDQNFFMEEKVDNRVVLTGRKIPLKEEFGNYIVDYLARFWTIGEIPFQQPILVSNMMIKRIIYKGFLTDEESEFTLNVLRTSQVVQQQISTAFMTTNDSINYYERFKENN